MQLTASNGDVLGKGGEWRNGIYDFYYMVKVNIFCLPTAIKLAQLQAVLPAVHRTLSFAHPEQPPNVPTQSR
jgi:hypothetical protein